MATSLEGGHAEHYFILSSLLLLIVWREKSKTESVMPLRIIIQNTRMMMATSRNGGHAEHTLNTKKWNNDGEQRIEGLRKRISYAAGIIVPKKEDDDGDFPRRRSRWTHIEHQKVK